MSLSFKVLFLIGLLPFLMGAAGELPSGPPGSRDFVQYYSACALVDAGLNPYRPELVLELQKSEGFLFPHPVMMWNPPPVLSLMCPFMARHLADSAERWMIINALLLVAAVLLAWFTFTSNGARLFWGLGCALLYLPAIDNIMSGQIGLLLALSLSAFLFCLSRGRSADFAAGLSVSLLIVKPHLFHLLAIAAVWLIFRERRFKLLAGFAAGAAVLGLSEFIVRPSLYGEWWTALHTAHFDVPVPTIWDWRPDALSGHVRAFARQAGISGKWPAFILPVVSSLTYAAYLLWKRPLNIVPTLPALAGVSLLTAPYGWFSDQAALIILPVGALAVLAGYRASWRRFRSTVLVLVILQVALNFVRPVTGGFWLPLALLLIWRRSTGGCQDGD